MKLTLCGSTRFEKEFLKWQKYLTLTGHVVYSLGTYPALTEDDTNEHYKANIEPSIKEGLDLVHLAKIEESEAIVVINVGGYIGESTRREIQWAKLRNKRVYWVESLEYNSLASTLLTIASPW
jgi:hypothetical protein